MPKEHFKNHKFPSKAIKYPYVTVGFDPALGDGGTSLTTWSMNDRGEIEIIKTETVKNTPKSTISTIDCLVKDIEIAKKAYEDWKSNARTDVHTEPKKDSGVEENRQATKIRKGGWRTIHFQRTLLSRKLRILSRNVRNR